MMELKLRIVTLVCSSCGTFYTFTGSVLDGNQVQGSFNFFAREVRSFWRNVSHRDSFELWDTSSATKGRCLLLGAEINGDGFSSSGVPSATARINISARSILIHKYNHDGTLVRNHSANCLIPTPTILSIDSLKKLARGERLKLEAAGRVEVDRLLSLSPRVLHVENAIKDSNLFRILTQKYQVGSTYEWSENEKAFIPAKENGL